MTNASKARVRKHTINGAKLVTAITALTFAVSGYLELAKRNELVYRALASKVNNMAEELSEVKGQNQVLMIFVQARMGSMMESMPADASPVEPDFFDGGLKSVSIQGMESYDEIEAEEEETTKMVIQAYQELPESLDDLMLVQEQLQAAK